MSRVFAGTRRFAVFPNQCFEIGPRIRAGTRHFVSFRRPPPPPQGGRGGGLVPISRMQVAVSWGKRILGCRRTGSLRMHRPPEGVYRLRGPVVLVAGDVRPGGAPGGAVGGAGPPEGLVEAEERRRQILEAEEAQSRRGCSLAGDVEQPGWRGAPPLIRGFAAQWPCINASTMVIIARAQLRIACSARVAPSGAIVEGLPNPPS